LLTSIAAAVPSFEYKAFLEQVVRSIGQSTVSKILTSKKESGTDHFSNAEREAVMKVF